ncbi:MAG TPA: hypothetical protein DHW02_12685 [Ktedonobacter sp.]|nr:hypothetical protein [Ktedonobacter sp.]
MPTMHDDDWYTEENNNTLDNGFNVELEDIPPEETDALSTTLSRIRTYVTRRMRHFKVTFTSQAPYDEDEDDDCEFDLRMTDVPLEELPASEHTPYFNQIRQSVMQGRRPRALLFSMLLLVMLVILANTITPLHDSLTSLFPASTATPIAQNPLSPYPGHLLDNPTNIVVEESKTTVSLVTVGGQQEYMYIPATVPYECPTTIIPGQKRQFGNFPIWLSGFGGANTILHLQPSYVLHSQDWQGWVVNFQVNAKMRYTSLILLTIIDVNHVSSPLLNDPTSGTHTWRIVLNPLKPQHAIGPKGKQYIGTWDMSLYLPGAGCYALNAAWEEGSWEDIFAAGR